MTTRVHRHGDPSRIGEAPRERRDGEAEPIGVTAVDEEAGTVTRSRPPAKGEPVVISAVYGTRRG